MRSASREVRGKKSRKRVTNGTVWRRRPHLSGRRERRRSSVAVPHPLCEDCSSANLHVTAGAGAGGFLNSTGWSTRTFDVSGLIGQSVTLTIYAINYGGDNSVETRLLIDNIQLTNGAPPVSTAPIPTLSQWALMALAVLLALRAAAALRRRG